MPNIFAILNVTTGTIAFTPNTSTQGALIDAYRGHKVVYMPSFELNADDVLDYHGDHFTSFEALFDKHGVDALSETFIYDSVYQSKALNAASTATTIQPKEDITMQTLTVYQRHDTTTVQKFLEDTFCPDEVDFEAIIDCLMTQDDDFTVDEVRFISEGTIDETLGQEISETLGYFNADFIAEHSPMPYEAAKALQEANEHEALGSALRAMLDSEQLTAFAEAYASHDGYGHHFNSYDGSTYEVVFNGTLYHVFAQFSH